MTSAFEVGFRVVHTPTGQAGVVVRVYADRVLVEDSQGDYRYWPLAEVTRRARDGRDDGGDWRARGARSDGARWGSGGGAARRWRQDVRARGV